MQFLNISAGIFVSMMHNTMQAFGKEHVRIVLSPFVSATGIGDVLASPSYSTIFFNHIVYLTPYLRCSYSM